MGGSGMVVVGVSRWWSRLVPPEQRQIVRRLLLNKRREQSGRAAHSGFTSRSLHSIELRMGSACYLLVLLAGLANAHEYFPEKCPAFTPMQGFDWDQVTLY